MAKSKRILCIPDTQCKPDVDLSYMTAIGRYIADKQPDVIVHLGDAVDFPSLSSYDKGKRSFEGRRLKADLEAGHEGMMRLVQPLKDLQERQRANKKKVYSPRMILTLGNHECVTPDTEVLTVDGFIPASEVTTETLVGSYSLDGKTLGFEPPIKMAVFYQQPLVKLSGDFRDEVVSSQHRIDIDGDLHPISDYAGTKVKQIRLRNSLGLENNGIPLTDDEIKILTWVVCDATIVHKSATNKRIQFKLSKDRKIKSLTSLLDAAGYKYTIREATKSALNKLQPYYICLYAEDALKICTLLGGVKQFPESFKSMSREQVLTLLGVLAEADGHYHFSKINWSTTSKHDVDVIQYACFTNGIPFAYNERQKASGFAGGKLQYHCKVAYAGLYERRYAAIEATGDFGDVIAIQTVRGTLVTRRNGRVNFTGNCRLDRLANDTPELAEFIGTEMLNYEQYGFEVYPFLKPVNIDGIFFVHYLSNPFTGKPYGGTALSQLKTVGRSFVVGHKQTLDIAMRPTLDGKTQFGIIAGACYDFHEEYKGEHNNHFRGVVMLHEVNDGNALPMPVSLEYLKSKYL